MTNEEAKRILCSVNCNGGRSQNRVAEALDLAIYALESIDRIKAKHDARDKLVDELEDRVYTLTAERDAAIADLTIANHGSCHFCKYNNRGKCEAEKIDRYGDCLEWSGVRDAD